jgi:hypothetical protein
MKIVVKDPLHAPVDRRAQKPGDQIHQGLRREEFRFDPLDDLFHKHPFKRQAAGTSVPAAPLSFLD